MSKASLQYACGCVLADCPAVRMHDHKGDTCMASPQCAPVGGAVDVSAR